MCKRLLWALALPALALGSSPALAWHHPYYSPTMPVAPVGMSYGVAGVQSFAVPSAYAAPAMSYAVPAASFAVPASSFAVPASSFAFPASGFNISASSLAVPVQGYSVSAPSQVVLTQSVAGGNAQAQATDLLTVIDTIRKITDALGGINLGGGSGGGNGGGGAGNSQLSAQVSKLAKTSADHEKRISAIEKQLKIQKPSTGGTSKLKMSKPTSDAVPSDQAPAQGVSSSGNTGDKEIQALIQAMQASQRAADAQKQAADAALPAIEYRIAVTQNSLDQLKTLRDQLKKAPAPPPPGPGEVLPKPEEKKP